MKETTLKFLKLNIKGLTIGIFLLILGYAILGQHFESAFAWHQMVLAPILLVVGYVSIGFSLMIHPKK